MDLGLGLDVLANKRETEALTKYFVKA